jgi:hypothetical protein
MWSERRGGPYSTTWAISAVDDHHRARHAVGVLAEPLLGAARADAGLLGEEALVAAAGVALVGDHRDHGGAVGDRPEPVRHEVPGERGGGGEVFLHDEPYPGPGLRPPPGVT